MTTLQLAILAYLRAHPGANYRELATGCNAEQYDIINQCIALKRAGQIEGDARAYKLCKMEE